MKDIIWFKNVIEPHLKDFEVKYKYFAEGDFGSLNQIEFNSREKGGEIDFWSTGWLSLHLVDYVSSEELLNVLLEPHEEEEKEKAFEMLLRILINEKV